MSKRRIALFMILSILLSLVVTTTAQPLTDIDDSPHREAIEQMVELGVLAGRGDGLFWPDDNLTRAEAAKVAMYLAGFDEEDAAVAAALPQAFDDVYAGMGRHEWALGWINLAAQEGIIEGYGDGKYGPGDTLQMIQWATILIRVLGYETKGLAWPTGYDQMADELGLTEGLEYVSRSHIRRDQMAKFSTNAVYDILRADGSRIIDFFEPTGISIALSKEVLAEGGGKTATITVTVTDKEGNPIKGAKVRFEAFCFEFDRNAQLSKSEVNTDASGKAKVTYTSLAADDKKMVGIEVAVFNDDPVIEEFKQIQILAANSAAVVSGLVKDPFTGSPMKDLQVNFMLNDTQNVAWTETDDAGRYRAVVPTGRYYINFDTGLRGDRIIADLTSINKTYTVDYNKGIIKGVLTGVATGTEVQAFNWSYFDRNDEATWEMPAYTQSDGSFTLVVRPRTYELFITGRDTGFKTGVIVKSGQVTDIGSVKAK